MTTPILKTGKIVAIAGQEMKESELLLFKILIGLLNLNPFTPRCFSNSAKLWLIVNTNHRNQACVSWIDIKFSKQT